MEFVSNCPPFGHVPGYIPPDDEFDYISSDDESDYISSDDESDYISSDDVYYDNFKEHKKGRDSCMQFTDCEYFDKYSKRVGSTIEYTTFKDKDDRDRCVEFANRLPPERKDDKNFRFEKIIAKFPEKSAIYQKLRGRGIKNLDSRFVNTDFCRISRSKWLKAIISIGDVALCAIGKASDDDQPVFGLACTSGIEDPKKVYHLLEIRMEEEGCDPSSVRFYVVGAEESATQAISFCEKAAEKGSKIAGMLFAPTRPHGAGVFVTPEKVLVC